MNIKLRTPTGQCEVKRCRQKTVATVPGECFGLDGKRVAMCQRHVDMATKEYDLHEIDGAVQPLEGAATAMVEVPEEELAEATREAKGALEVARELEIETQEDLELVSAWIKEAKGRGKLLKDRLEEITKPLNESLKSIRALFKPPIDACDKIEAELKAKVAAHIASQAERNQAAMEIASEAVEAGDTELAEQALATVTEIGNVDGISHRTSWAFEIEDESKLPREWLVPDLKAIGAHARAAKGDEAPAPIPGVKFSPKVTVVARTG